MTAFEWDAAKAASNRLKHGIDFEDAIAIFENPVLEVRSDRGGEVRWKALGEVDGLVIAVVYTLRRERCRLISARKARENEREAYGAAFRGAADG